MSARVLTAAAALVAAATSVVPAAAHTPRDHRRGAVRVDVEVLVPPPVTGRTTGGARDAQVVVDRFGNRIALARTSLPVGTVDSRSRFQARNGPWLWGSYDDGASWEDLELLPRAAEYLPPQVDAVAIAASGATTYVAYGTPAGALVVPVVASKRGRLVPGTPAPIVAPRVPGTSFELAADRSGPLLLVGGPTGVQVLGHGVTLATLPSADSCDLAAGVGPVLAVVACLRAGAVQRTTVRAGGRTSTVTLGPADVRGGDTGAPTVDVGTDGATAVLSGTRLWWTEDGETERLDLRSEPGDYRSTAVAVSNRERIAVGGYRRGKSGAWDVVVTLFTPGSKPVWVDFAYHDPAALPGAGGPPSERVSVDTDPLGRLQLMWTVNQALPVDVDRPLLHNVWAVRSITS
jgi:hypothetical protein